jgi:hypothetical protein
MLLSREAKALNREGVNMCTALSFATPLTCDVKYDITQRRTQKDAEFLR